ncbi:MAG: acetate uptake transporter [Chthoniobacterales bacterium]|jgi:succinate-acetate transporter protein
MERLLFVRVVGQVFEGPIMSSERTVAPPTQSVADPAPLGLAGFALTTFVLSTVNAGWIPKSGEPVVLGLAFAYGGLAQFCAGMWEFKRNNTFGATAFTSYGGFWIAFALLVTFNVAGIPAEARPAAVGTFLLAWGIFTAYMTVAATTLSRPVLVVFILLTITFFVLAFGAFSSQAGVTVLGGYLGLLTAIAAWYASAITVIASTRKR